ncbi:MAG: CYTH domain-containing protein [Prevotellaceae bacterium]|nr:CYTH domain-containing protein [Prevotellaceae bacterium]
MIEIERKFLVNPSIIGRLKEGKLYTQAYLCKEKERTVRIRIAENRAFLTIKGKTSGFSRTEFEYEIPPEDAETLLSMCAGVPIRKTRYKVFFGNHTWEVDVFGGENEGLLLAEIELKSEDEAFEIPDWATREVTGDGRYYNSYLAGCPFCAWA